MKSENSSELIPQPSPQPKPDTSSASEMLTASEIEQLKQAKKEQTAYAQKVYPGLRVLELPHD